MFPNMYEDSELHEIYVLTKLGAKLAFSKCGVASCT
jgi:hypothetical protein